ncbi:hypothetical protein ILUMI_01461 [Ignelater luminosus]|uniref:Major facilitator superfamily (MFS) profile domain-containing protein n=1 Tax=Ignelater luminosus TaxID=2038154 RepID=A0A8K0GP74_IGNLU|nr:hypothetical protein ILUMI_01461 [Ignelater luminosus]
MTVQIKPINIEKTGKSQQWPQFLAVLSACSLAIGTGLQSGWSTPAVPRLLSNDLDFEITQEEVSIIVMIAPLGYLIGSPFAGFILDRIGRKYTLLILSIPQITAWILTATCQNVPMLCVARFITGISDGSFFTSLPIYMGEVCEPTVRGVLGTSQSMTTLIGTLLMAVYGSYVPIRTAACISLSAPLLFLITFVWMPESPYYLLMKNRTEDARKSLKWLRRMDNVEDELMQISRDVQRQISESGRLRDVFIIKSNLKGFLTLVGLRAVQQFAGISVLMFYVQVIFKEANMSEVTPAVSSIICCGTQLISAYFSSLVIDRFGRKPLFIFSCIGSAILLFIMGGYFTLQKYGEDVSTFSWIPLAAMMLYFLVVAMGLLIVPNLMAGELLSTSVKSKALGVMHMYLGVTISVVSVLFQWLVNYGMDTPFYVFGVCALTGTLFCYFYVVETKGKTLEEIQQELKGNHCSNSMNNHCN